LSARRERLSKRARSVRSRRHSTIALVIELATEEARTAIRSFLGSEGYRDTGLRFGWTPTCHFIDPQRHPLPADRAFRRDPEVEVLQEMTEEILRLVPAGETYILVDEERWWAGLAADGRRRLPFLERDGVYWGRPEDDRTAVDELLCLKRTGARYILFAESAF
jgi:hypothetical protein